MYTANVLTIKTMEYNHVPNPTKIWAKVVETVGIIRNYLVLKIHEIYGLLPIKTVKKCKVHSQQEL